MSAPTPIPITATLQSIAGVAAATGAKLRINLGGYGLTQPAIVGTSLLAEVYKVVPFSGSALSFNLYGNDVISPGGTFYTIRVEDAAGNLIMATDFVFTGAGPIDLANAAPYVPGPPAPGLQYVVCPPAPHDTTHTQFVSPGLVIAIGLRGLIKRPGIDYTLSAGNLITMDPAVPTGDVVYALCVV